MDIEEIRRHIVDTLPGTDVLEAFGDLYFVHDPRRDLPDTRKIPWATLVTSNAHDEFSGLDRPGVFRLNVGLTRDEFAGCSRTGPTTTRPHSTCSCPTPSTAACAGRAS